MFGSRYDPATTHDVPGRNRHAAQKGYRKERRYAEPTGGMRRKDSTAARERREKMCTSHSVGAEICSGLLGNGTTSQRVPLISPYIAPVLLHTYHIYLSHVSPMSTASSSVLVASLQCCAASSNELMPINLHFPRERCRAGQAFDPPRLTPAKPTLKRAVNPHSPNRASMPAVAAVSPSQYHHLITRCTFCISCPRGLVHVHRAG